VGRILPCRDGPFREFFARLVDDVAWENAVEGLDGRGARQEKRPERCMHCKRAFEDRQLSHGKRHGKGGQHILRHWGVLHQEEDKTVRRPGLVRMGVMVSRTRQSREMMDQMGARGGDQCAEPQHSPERCESLAEPAKSADLQDTWAEVPSVPELLGPW
jgi:hypothetical protein